MISKSYIMKPQTLFVMTWLLLWFDPAFGVIQLQLWWSSVWSSFFSQYNRCDYRNISLNPSKQNVFMSLQRAIAGLLFLWHIMIWIWSNWFWLIVSSSFCLRVLFRFGLKSISFSSTYRLRSIRRNLSVGEVGRFNFVTGWLRSISSILQSVCR